MRKAFDNERGMTMVFTAVAMSAFLAFTVVGVDLARLALTATEVQTVADAAATAGARALVDNNNAVSQAQRVVAQNTVDGKTASIAAQDVQVGHYDFATGTFVPSLPPYNGVRATGRTTVENFVAGVLGSPATTVTKTATAAFGGLGSALPPLPIVVGECHFQQFQRSLSCSSLPSLTQVPDEGDNSGWTSLSNTDSASTSAIKDYLDRSCGGLGLPPPTLHVGDYIKVTGGQNASVLAAIDTCVLLGKRTYVIPIVPCGSADQYNQSMQIVGFATITIDSVNATGRKKGLNLSAICKAESGPGTGGLFGTTAVAMVQ